MTATDKVHLLEIHDGPSADRIFDAVRYAHDTSVTIPTWFKVSTRGPRTMRLEVTPKILGVEHESGSGYSLAIRGIWQLGELRGQPFIGSYNAVCRTGYFKVTVA